MTDEEIYTEVSKLQTIYNEQERVAALEGAKWMQEQIINKACEWWVAKLNSIEPVDFEKWVKEFRKAMKGE